MYTKMFLAIEGHILQDIVMGLGRLRKGLGRVLGLLHYGWCFGILVVCGGGGAQWQVWRRDAGFAELGVVFFLVFEVWGFVVLDLADYPG